MNESLWHSSSGDDDDAHHFIDLGLDDRGLRIGHWNENRLSLSKLDEIKLLLFGKNNIPQSDLLFLNQTFLKTDIPYSIYSIPGFNIFLDRRYKAGGGVLAFVNESLEVKRRTDLEYIHTLIIIPNWAFQNDLQIIESNIYKNYKTVLKSN